MGTETTMGEELRLDLNCDLGESFGAYKKGCDADLIPCVTSVNIACGLHAGDPNVMCATVRLAAENGVAIGAHPGYPDLQGFGRRDMALSSDEISAFVLYQIGALDAFCRAEGAILHHVKPHGQLYNRAARDRETADAIVDAICSYDAELIVVGLANSCLIAAARAADLPYAEEFFADRAYNDDGTLVARGTPGALITDETQALERTLEAVRTGSVTSISGSPVAVHADTVCVHGDNERALAFVHALREGLLAAGVMLEPADGQRAKAC